MSHYAELRTFYSDWPHEVSIETQAICNAKCGFCPYTTLERIGEKMPDAMLDIIIEQLKAHPEPFIISPFKVNEPFLDKRLLPFCRKVNAELPQAWLRLFTNGSALTAANVAGVARLERVYHLWCSLNEHRPDEYKALMGLDWGRTVSNLDHVHNEIVAGRFPHKMMVSKVTSLDADIDNGFRAFVADRWPRFGCMVIKRDGWLGHVEPSNPAIPDTPCVRWWELSITATGLVSLCCMDGEGKHAIGDLRTQTIHEIYNGKAWKARRMALASRRNSASPCSNCTYG